MCIRDRCGAQLLPLRVGGGQQGRGLGKGLLQTRLQTRQTLAFVLVQQCGEKCLQVSEGAGRQRLLPALLGFAQALLQLLQQALLALLPATQGIAFALRAGQAVDGTLQGLLCLLYTSRCV